MSNEQVFKKPEDENQQQTAGAGQPLAGSNQTGNTQSRVSNFSTGSAPGSQGSGRFTNIQKYINANQNASGNLGAKANETINKGFNQTQSQVTEANNKIQQAFQQGKSTLDQGKGFQNQLGQIGSGLQTGFSDFSNRGAFGTAAEQANAFTKDKAQFDAYKNIASGQGIDDTQLKQSQGLANQLSTDLLNRAKQGLQGIETESGRDQLFSEVLQPKQGYTQGQRSFDKLFLGNALGGIKTNLMNNQNTANKLVGDVGIQGNNVNSLIAQEADLIKGLTGQAKTNQDLFNQALYGTATATDPQGNLSRNLAQVNAARTQNYQNMLSDIKGGKISQEQAALLGLDKADTYIDNNQAAGSQKNLIGTYNILNDPNALNNYLKQGADAMNARDITTEADYNTYKALQDLALGRDTGMVSGVSGLGSSVQQTGSLLDAITAADKSFKDQYAGRTFSGTGADAFQNYALTGQGRGFNDQNVLNQRIQNNVTTPVNNSGNAQIGARGVDTAGVRNALVQGAGNWGSQYYGSAAAATNNTNIDDYIKNNLLGTTNADKAYDVGGSAGTYNTNAANASARAEANVRNLLDQTIKDTGVKNALEVDASKTNELKKRFGNLV